MNKPNLDRLYPEVRQPECKNCGKEFRPETELDNMCNDCVLPKPTIREHVYEQSPRWYNDAQDD